MAFVLLAITLAFLSLLLLLPVWLAIALDIAFILFLFGYPLILIAGRESDREAQYGQKSKRQGIQG